MRPWLVVAGLLLAGMAVPQGSADHDPVIPAQNCNQSPILVDDEEVLVAEWSLLACPIFNDATQNSPYDHELETLSEGLSEYPDELEAWAMEQGLIIECLLTTAPIDWLNCGQLTEEPPVPRGEFDDPEQYGCDSAVKDFIDGFLEELQGVDPFTAQHYDYLCWLTQRALYHFDQYMGATVPGWSSAVQGEWHNFTLWLEWADAVVDYAEGIDPDVSYVGVLVAWATGTVPAWLLDEIPPYATGEIPAFVLCTPTTPPIDWPSQCVVPPTPPTPGSPGLPGTPDPTPPSPPLSPFGLL